MTLALWRSHGNRAILAPQWQVIIPFTSCAQWPGLAGWASTVEMDGDTDSSVKQIDPSQTSQSVCTVYTEMVMFILM